MNNPEYKKNLKYLLIFLMLIFFLISLASGIIKFPELQRFFLFIYNYISAAQLSWIHDFSGLALVGLIIFHLVMKRRWFGKRLSVELHLSKLTKNILYTLLIIVLAGLVVSYLVILDIGNTSPTDLSSVEVKDYQGEKLGSINDFRENSIKGVQHIKKDSYKLDIVGLISEPIQLSYDEVLQLPSYQKVVTLNCVEGWSVKALWEGVLVRDLFEKTDIKPEAKTVIFYAVDGYSTSFPLDYILNNDIIMAAKLNGVTLPPERGFPFQLVAEQKWGYKWIKWITKIELSDDENYKGFWESRGYNNDGDYNGSKYSR